MLYNAYKTKKKLQDKTPHSAVIQNVPVLSTRTIFRVASGPPIFVIDDNFIWTLVPWNEIEVAWKFSSWNKKIQIEINEIVVFNESFAREVFIIRRVETFDEASNFLFEGEAEAAQWSKGRSILMINN